MHLQPATTNFQPASPQAIASQGRLSQPSSETPQPPQKPSNLLKIMHFRTGKIARLPRKIRQQFNQRLRNSLTSNDLPSWNTRQIHCSCMKLQKKLPETEGGLNYNIFGEGHLLEILQQPNRELKIKTKL
jgi:hypothetical protein